MKSQELLNQIGNNMSTTLGRWEHVHCTCYRYLPTVPIGTTSNFFYHGMQYSVVPVLVTVQYRTVPVVYAERREARSHQWYLSFF